MGDIAYETMEDYRARIRELEDNNSTLERCCDIAIKNCKEYMEENRKLKEKVEELEKEIEELNKMMLFETELEK